jgi:signal transduction histidine kinase
VRHWEEAYSIAISLQEYLEKTGAVFPVQVFASDVSEPAIEKARRGIFSEKISSEVSPDRLDRYFTKVEEGYQVGKALRDLCVFSRHNLINDPPFGRLDLISCRNVLIYLGAIQKNIIPVFHYALKPNSFLMLGKSETASFESMFSIVDRGHKIYMKRELARRAYGLHARAGVPRWGADGGKMASQAAMIELPNVGSAKAVDRILLSKYSPAGVLVDEGLEVLEIRGDVTPFFRLPAGEASFHLLKLAPDTGLFLEIEKLVHEAAKKGEAIRRARVPYERDGTVCEVNIEATPLTGNQRRAVFVLLDPASSGEEGVGKSPEKPVAHEEAIGIRDRQIAKLREEVAEARRRLLSVVEENQVWDEASQTAAEEALSANEELQSLNEEMETAKEELQSTNEELITLNQELESKNVAVTESRNEAQIALFHSQESLRRAETMEAIGRLAGGIAHDFNNLLTTIVGYTHMVGGALRDDHEAIEYVREIENAAQRAASLTDQLLSFSRRKVLQPKVFDLNAVVADFERMLRRVLGEQIQVVVRAASDLRRVRADPGEIGRALMNLCLNARDAMPAGGSLIIQTANVTLVEAEAGLHNLAAGPYVELSVLDTGVGMLPDVSARVFEPFFTTKETGKGTGLGLPTVLGIVEQSGGAIWCQSKLGQGTIFKILLPALEVVPAESDEIPTGGLTEPPRGSAEVILLVEDEEPVRKLTSRILQSLGYVVLQAQGGHEGLSVCEGHQGKIDLLLCDVLMPNLGGRELAERILTMRPDIKVLFMSGHTEDVVLKEGVKAGTPFLPKPFAPTDLARKVREVLDWSGRTPGSEKS